MTDTVTTGPVRTSCRARRRPGDQAARADKINISTISFCGCWGCTLSILDMDERLLPLLDKVTIMRSSLTDIKRIPERCTMGFVEGGVANEENIETLEHFRENCDILISVGACALWGGVPSLRNTYPLADCSPRHTWTARQRRKAPNRSFRGTPRSRGSPRGVPLSRGRPHGLLHARVPASGDAVFAVFDDLVNGVRLLAPQTHRFD